MTTMKNQRFKLLMPLMIVLAYALPVIGGGSDCGREKVSEVTGSKLQPFYKGDNGSLVYVRQAGSQIYWFAERFDKNFASVFKGSISGSQITGTYYYIPKGVAKGSGNLKIVVSNGGKTLTISGNKFNEQVLQATKLPAKLPAPRRAHYRGNTTGNLTGRWHADNSGEMHLLDDGKTIAGYFRGWRSNNNGRPFTAKVFFGIKSGSGVKIEWIDIPLGNTSCRGKASFKIVGPQYLRVDGGYFPGLNHERLTDDNYEIIK
jgi:hypothetical protein